MFARMAHGSSREERLSRSAKQKPQNQPPSYPRDALLTFGTHRPFLQFPSRFSYFWRGFLGCLRVYLSIVCLSTKRRPHARHNGADGVGIHPMAVVVTVITLLYKHLRFFFLPSRDIHIANDPRTNPELIRRGCMNMKPDILALCILATTILCSRTRHVAGFLTAQSTASGGAGGADGAKMGDHQGVASVPQRLHLPILAVGGGPVRQGPALPGDVLDAQERAVYDPGDGES